jgi:hypothetical protein
VIFIIVVVRVITLTENLGIGRVGDRLPERCGREHKQSHNLKQVAVVVVCVVSVPGPERVCNWYCHARTLPWGIVRTHWDINSTTHGGNQVATIVRPCTRHVSMYMRGLLLLLGYITYFMKEGILSMCSKTDILLPAYFDTRVYMRYMNTVI